MLLIHSNIVYVNNPKGSIVKFLELFLSPQQGRRQNRNIQRFIGVVYTHKKVVCRYNLKIIFTRLSKYKEDRRKANKYSQYL